MGKKLRPQPEDSEEQNCSKDLYEVVSEEEAEVRM